MKKNYILYLVLVPCFCALVTHSLRAQATIPPQDQDSLISQATGLVNQESLRAFVQSLQDMGTRFMMADNRREVAEWIKASYESLGITEVRLDSFQCYTNINMTNLHYDTTTWQYNVEARIEGWEFPEEEVVILGHYDDVMQVDDPEIYAPGADDNASGTAAAFEVARVMMEMDYQPRRTTVFLSSAAEELMYFGDSGTEHYAAEAAADGRNIVMVINNDMIGYDDGVWTVDISQHLGSEEITWIATYITETYTTLNYDLWPLASNVGGDIQPFFNEGYLGVYFMEHTFNPYYHAPGDTIGNCDMAYMAEVTKISMGCVMFSDLTVGIEADVHAPASAQVYPNPTTGPVKIKLSGEDKNAEYHLVNYQGASIFSKTLENVDELDISSFPPGIYFLDIITGHHRISSRIIKL